MNAKLLLAHALTPLHPGTGQGVGVIDLPIAREVATGLPYLPGSSLKGVLRDVARGTNGLEKTKRHLIFGPDTQNASDHAGAVQFTDQRLLLFPVRSLRGTFAWVTSPLVLHRFVRDLKAAGINNALSVPNVAVLESCIIPASNSIADSGKVYLEDLDLSVGVGDAQGWASWIANCLFEKGDIWHTTLTQRFCLVHDDVFSFLLQSATEVIARIRLKEESKTVAKGGLWYEEALPAESILAGLVVATPVKEKSELTSEGVFEAITTLTHKPVQVGGNATVGRGVCQLRLVGGA